jgi:RNA polymerase sigma-70 factor (sigma-E family)
MEPCRGFVRHTGVVQTTQKGLALVQIEPVSEDDRPSADAPRPRTRLSSRDLTVHRSGPDVMGTQPVGEIEDLYRIHRRPMVRLARLLTSSPALAEEIVQEAFIKFARSAGKKDEPAAYLRVIVVNLCRSQQRRTLVERRLAPRAPVLSGVTEIDETWDLVRKLPFRQRAVLMLRYYEDLSEADIARVLGCRPGTVKSALHRGLAALRKKLGDPGEEQERRRTDA